MTERKWTPGPWDAMANGWIEASDGDPVCMINDAGLPNSTFSEDFHNARLIAAAPELYDGNEWLIKTLSYVLAGKPVRDADEAIYFAKKVQAKARGET